MRTLSVISTTRARRSRPAAAVALSISAGSPGSSSSRAERFHAHQQAVVAEPVAQHRQVGARALEEPAAERDDEAGLLGQRDEDIGRDRAALRVRPARERLDGADAAGRELDERLVVDLELVAGERALEVGLELEALDGAGEHRRVELR
jgi:hypothetical protein